MTVIQDLPMGWAIASVGDVCSQPQYGYTTKASNSGDLRLLRTSDITPGRINWETVPYCSENPNDLEKYILKDGDILVSRAGSVGVSHLVTKPLKAIFASYLIRFKPFIDRRFFGYFLQSPDYWVTIADEKLGIAVPNVNATKLKSIMVPVPPAREQHRIVAKIEELFSELDKGIESLKTARAQLKVYRQAVLKHAFEGKLTAQWREENKDKLEKLEQLLAHIKQEREARYERQLKEWKAAVKIWQECGKSGQKPRKPKTPVTLFLPRKGEIANLPSLPNSWLWIKVQALLAEPLANGHSVKDRASGFPVLRLTAIKTEKLDLSEAKNGDWEYEDALSYLVQQGDFLLARGNGSKRLVGRGGVVPAVERDVAYPDTMIRLRLDPKVVDGSFFSYVWNSRLLREQIEGTARTTAGIYKINQGHILDFMVPLCSLSEQEVVVERLSVILSTIDAMEATIDNQLLKADALRQSVLKGAFAGQLVAQDPSDEPASVLLDQIKAEKASKSRESTKRTRKKRTVA